MKDLKNKLNKDPFDNLKVIQFVLLLIWILQLWLIFNLFFLVVKLLNIISLELRGGFLDCTIKDTDKLYIDMKYLE